MARLLAAVDLGETLEWTVATAQYLQGGARHARRAFARGPQRLL
jgi:hypothetical protein